MHYTTLLAWEPSLIDLCKDEVDATLRLISILKGLGGGFKLTPIYKAVGSLVYERYQEWKKMTELAKTSLFSEHERDVNFAKRYQAFQKFT